VLYGLTGDPIVTYSDPVRSGDVFKALADPSRRLLLDLLLERDGQTLGELESNLEMTRFGVMKHLRVLEAANLVVTRRSGREKLHYLNPMPIRQIYDRWVSKYAEPWTSGLSDLRKELEDQSGDQTEARLRVRDRRPAREGVAGDN
jgi:DNA-binding transcriptional ArsR family regulator